MAKTINAIAKLALGMIKDFESDVTKLEKIKDKNSQDYKTKKGIADKEVIANFVAIHNHLYDYLDKQYENYLKDRGFTKETIDREMGKRKR